ncbi:hypothetical protein KC352_g13685 [Hortaea werneckii]|nr:hypothetical protein KC352_g13685 [Hortaea werneckii]KAI7349433.1 hypothetical protein KC320_g6030 [Hortaea werneckii]KAI7612558.1 hypothetical protein KC346_g7766 [Hortaea werneckii]
MEEDNAHEGPSASRPSIGKNDVTADGIATMSEDISKMTIQEARQSQDESIIREQIALAVGKSASLLELRRTVDRGYGLFAAEDIKRGTCIFKEAPLFVVPPDTTLVGPDKVSLSLKRKTHANVEDVVHRQVDDYAIFTTNNLQMRFGGQHGTAVYTTYRVETLQATRDIAAGEEITVSYTDLLRTRNQRAASLKKWGFTCACKCCKGANSSISQARRQRMFDIDQAIAFHDCTDPFQKTMQQASQTLPVRSDGKLRWAEELAKLCGEEGLTDMDQAKAYRECSRWCLELGKLKAAFEFANKELEIQRVCYGNDFKPVDDAEAWVSKLQDRIDEQRKAAVLAEEQRLYEEGLKADKAAYQEGKKAWAADKKVNKKAKRAIKAAAEKAGLTTEDAEALLARIDNEKLAVVAEKLKGEDDIEKVKSIIAELRS